ncbi:hypothetical protein [Clostridium ganghwense]|uniref:Uncharacterized protein n=1 Tax=Clostridium ganghwense TaxID=312089 RepID=A0ABT4CKW7_9CLOT|nr:hypothetical protein [Clostridium ganghwense]MCY6369677.1 hypothetical protein [Clostridium ganghwense]
MRGMNSSTNINPNDSGILGEDTTNISEMQNNIAQGNGSELDNISLLDNDLELRDMVISENDPELKDMVLSENDPELRDIIQSMGNLDDFEDMIDVVDL